MNISLIIAPESDLYCFSVVIASKEQQTTAPILGHPGYLTGKLFRLRSKEVPSVPFTVKIAREEQATVKCGAIEIDVRTGDIIMDGKEQDVAQYLCLAYSIAALHLLCQPHGQAPGKPVPTQLPIFNKPPEHRPPTDKRRSSVIYMDEYVSHYPFLASAGLYCSQVPHYAAQISCNSDDSEYSGNNCCSVWGASPSPGIYGSQVAAFSYEAGCGGCSGSPNRSSNQCGKERGKSESDDYDIFDRIEGGASGYCDGETKSFYAGTVVSAWWGSGGCSS